MDLSSITDNLRQKKLSWVYIFALLDCHIIMMYISVLRSIAGYDEETCVTAPFRYLRAVDSPLDLQSSLTPRCFDRTCTRPR